MVCLFVARVALVPGRLRLLCRRLLTLLVVGLLIVLVCGPLPLLLLHV